MYNKSFLLFPHIPLDKARHWLSEEKVWLWCTKWDGSRILRLCPNERFCSSVIPGPDKGLGYSTVISKYRNCKSGNVVEINSVFCFFHSLLAPLVAAAFSSPPTLSLPLPLSRVVHGDKDRAPVPHAVVKPQVLTHLIEGFVIQEGAEPFPVSEPCHDSTQFTFSQRFNLNSAGCALLCKKLFWLIWHDRLLDSSKIEILPWLAAQRTELHVSVFFFLMKVWYQKAVCVVSIYILISFSTSVLKCEYCGSLAPASQFRGSKRFCSNTCAKRWIFLYILNFTCQQCLQKLSALHKR